MSKQSAEENTWANRVDAIEGNRRLSNDKVHNLYYIKYLVNQVNMLFSSL
jgi:hypothetical protein